MVEPKVFDLLLHLIENRDRVVSKDDLIAKVWRNRSISDSALTHAINAARNAIGDDGKKQRLIRTFSRRGYRFVGSVRRQAGEEPAAGLDGATSAPNGPALPLPDKPSIAVLPFHNIGDDPEQEYFVDGLVEDIITALSRFKSLFVIARNSSFAFKGQSPDVRDVGRRLGVRYVLEGSVRKSGSRLRVTGQLIDAESGAHLWADRFDGSLGDVFALQDSLTASVVSLIAPRVERAEIERARATPAGDLKAYDLLLRAQALMRTRSRPEIEQAIGLLRQAVTIDAGYARAFANLAWACWQFVTQGFGHRDHPTVAGMVDAARRGLALDSEDSHVAAIAASILSLPGGDPASGPALIEKAVLLNPSNVDALRIAGVIFGYLGELDGAIGYLQRAERLNHLDAGLYGSAGYAIAYFGAGQHDGVLEWTARVLRELPNFAPALRYRAASLALTGRVGEAREVIGRLLAQTPQYSMTEMRRHHEFDLNAPFKRPGVTESLYLGLRLAGLPE